MATTGLRTMVVTTGGGPEGAPVAVPSTPSKNLKALAHAVGYRPLLDRGLGEPRTRLEGPRGKEVLQGKNPEITEELRNDFFELACNKLEKMIEERRSRSPEEFNRWVTDSGHSSDLELFNRFTMDKQGAGRYRDVNTEKLREFMDTDRGLAAIYQMELRDSEEADFADAVKNSLAPQSPEPSVLRETRHELQGSGGLRKGLRIVQHWARTPNGRPGGRGLERDQTTGGEGVWRFFVDTNGRVTASVTGLASTLGTGGFVVGNALFPGVGGIVGGGVGALSGLAAAGVGRLLRRGETMGLELSAHQLSYMLDQQNGAIMEWSRAMNNINPRDMDVTPDGRVEMRGGGHVALTPVNDRDRREQHEARHLRIKKYQAAMGIRNEYQDVTSMNWLIEGRLVPPRPGTPFMKQVMNEFNANNDYNRPGGGGIRDINNESFWTRNAFGEVVRNPAFQPTNLDTMGNVDRWRAAYDRVLRREITTTAVDIMHGGTNYRGELLKQIDKKKQDRAGDLQRNKDRLEKRKNALEADGTRFGENGETKTFTDFQTSVAKIRAEINDTLTSIRPAGGNSPRTIERAMQGLDAILTTPGSGPITLNGRTIESIVDLRTQLEADITDAIDDYRIDTIDPIDAQVTTAREALTGIAGPPPIIGRREAVAGMPVGTPPERAAKAAAEASLTQLEANLMDLQKQLSDARMAEPRRAELRTTEFADRVQEIEEQRRLVMETLTTLREQQTKLSEATSAANEERNKVDETIGRMTTSYNTMINWLMPGLTQAELATEGFDVLMRTITDNYAPPDGWPEEDQYDPNNRAMLLNAMIKARARAAEPAIVAPLSRIDDVIAPGGIPEIDLYTLSPAEIRRLSIERGVPPPPFSLTGAQARAVKTEAMARFVAHQTAQAEIQRDIEARQRRNEDEAKRLEKDGIRTPELDVIRRMVDRYGIIRDGILNHENQMQFLNEFLSLDPILGGPLPPGSPPSVYADYERDGIGNFNAKRNIQRLTGDYTNDSEARFGAERGAEASLHQQEAILNDEVWRELLTTGFNLGFTFFGAAQPIGNFRRAVRVLRWSAGLDPLPPGVELTRSLITPDEIARVLSHNLSDHLKRLVDRY